MLPLHVHKHLHIDLNPSTCCSESKKGKAVFFLLVPDLIFPDGIKIEFKSASTCVDSGVFFLHNLFSHKRFANYKNNICTYTEK